MNLAETLTDFASELKAENDRADEKDRTTAARTLIRAWMLENDARTAEDMLEAEDGELAGLLLATWPAHNLAEVVTETPYFVSDFQSDLVEAMKDRGRNLAAQGYFGTYIAAHAIRYILSCHRADAEAVAEEFRDTSVEDGLAAAHDRYERAQGER